MNMPCKKKYSLNLLKSDISTIENLVIYFTVNFIFIYKNKLLLSQSTYFKRYHKKMPFSVY